MWHLSKDKASGDVVGQAVAEILGWFLVAGEEGEEALDWPGKDSARRVVHDHGQGLREAPRRYRSSSSLLFVVCLVFYLLFVVLISVDFAQHLLAVFIACWCGQVWRRHEFDDVLRKQARVTDYRMRLACLLVCKRAGE